MNLSITSVTAGAAAACGQLSRWSRRVLQEPPLVIRLLSGLGLSLVVGSAACSLSVIPYGTAESKAGPRSRVMIDGATVSYFPGF